MAHRLGGLASAALGVDIHPAAPIGRGVLLDHATGIVIGETAVVGDGVTILQGVTLGATGKQRGDRHPKVRAGVLLGAGALVLGNIEIGTMSKVGAGSVVLSAVPAALHGRRRPGSSRADADRPPVASPPDRERTT
jgi:serine O-acetyltransferase